MFELVYVLVPEYNFKDSPVVFISLRRLFGRLYEDLHQGKPFIYAQIYYTTEVNGKVEKYLHTCTPETLAQFSKADIHDLVWKQFKLAAESEE